MPDGCGNVITCGGLCNQGNHACVANVCTHGSCTPTTCQAAGKNCGIISDGCGDVVDGHMCPTGKVCVNNVCQ